MAFVKVRPPTQNHHLRASKPSDQQLPGMAADTHRGKARQFGVRNLRCHFHFVEDMVKPAAQDYRKSWPKMRKFLELRSGGGRERLSHVPRFLAGLLIMPG